MKMNSLQASQLAAALAVVALIGFGAGRYNGGAGGTATAVDAAGGRKPLYYYDPMLPNQKFDKPGKSPFMDMELVPKYADGGGSSSGPADAPAVTINPAAMQNLGVRIVAAHRDTLATLQEVTGTIAFNERNVAIVQARSGGFVQRGYSRAPGDLVPAGAPLADLLVPDWGGAQREYLAVRRTGDAALASAARQRLILLGMPSGLIDAVAKTGRMHDVTAVTTPIGGVIDTLDVRPGMTLAMGQPLARVVGLGSVWLDAAVPEARIGDVRPGARVTATLAAFPDEQFPGRVQAVLPTAQSDSRTVTVRVELANPGLRLRPGMFARVALGEGSRSALLIPSEAVIRTGKRTLVMLAAGDGRYQPAEVQIGRESGGQTEVLAGLAEGEKVVASGQFLLDSEASLTGIPVRPIGATAMSPKP
ncbi:efflux RND transporter periplasmic adaptor subunit [Sphingomonas sp. GlSt437]|uniref:efflux RND transporter periplasmic adaptor subunit n=1 Tax=Sphingomonas sp. GlSt437 TaxID=3389970 RepID=UPI003A8B8C71